MSRFFDLTIKRQRIEEPPISNLPETDMSGVFMIRDANDPEVVKRQGQSDTSNFAPIKTASFSNTQKVDFNGVSRFQKNVSNNFLRSLQFNEPGTYGSVDKKMAWFGQAEGKGKRPYWFINGIYIFGAVLFARTLVKVDTTPIIKRATFPSGLIEDAIFYRVIGAPKVLMTSGLTGLGLHIKYPYWVVKATAFGDSGHMNEYPRGATHLHCVWNDVDYPANYANGNIYVAKAFLL